ncbi:hypothetical protein VN97_g760 [Penicillium thymicola]|uniref:Uncharacterized protein n=1 Tax=Penicillium thymicola TaxID=293382 RepID=A0AAI9XCN7_PENTH|nr:hypothetical protein VN97_g760 [Penicillium thymicola]
MDAHQRLSKPISIHKYSLVTYKVAGSPAEQGQRKIINHGSYDKLAMFVLFGGHYGPEGRAQNPAHLRVGLGWALGFMGH